MQYKTYFMYVHCDNTDDAMETDRPIHPNYAAARMITSPLKNVSLYTVIVTYKVLGKSSNISFAKYPVKLHIRMVAKLNVLDCMYRDKNSYRGYII